MNNNADHESLAYLKALEDGCLNKLNRNLYAILKHKLAIPKKNEEVIVNTFRAVNEIILSRQKFIQ